MIEAHVIHIRVGSTLHVAAQAINTETGGVGPILSAEGCQFDQTEREVVVPDDSPGVRCGNCHDPLYTGAAQ